jgi:hypothetical protein
MGIDRPAGELGFKYVSRFQHVATSQRAEIGRLMKGKSSHVVSSSTDGFAPWN